jgi:hypothetical protein
MELKTLPVPASAELIIAQVEAIGYIPKGFVVAKSMAVDKDVVMFTGVSIRAEYATKPPKHKLVARHGNMVDRDNRPCSIVGYAETHKAIVMPRASVITIYMDADLVSFPETMSWYLRTKEEAIKKANDETDEHNANVVEENKKEFPLCVSKYCSIKAYEKGQEEWRRMNWFKRKFTYKDEHKFSCEYSDKYANLIDAKPFFDMLKNYGVEYGQER